MGQEGRKRRRGEHLSHRCGVAGNTTEFRGRQLFAASIPERKVLRYDSQHQDQKEKLIREKRKAMEKAAKELNFMEAAKLRDEIKLLQEQD